MREPFLAGATPIQRLSPMEDCGVDFFDWGGSHWCLLVDRFSGFPLAHNSVRCCTEDAIWVLENWFNLYGYPKYLRSDGGPAFRSEFGTWAKSKGIQLDLSSAYNPSSNGLAEAGVARVKKLIQRAVLAKENVQDALAIEIQSPMLGQLLV